MCGEVEKRTFRFTKHIASFYFFGTFRFADYTLYMPGPNIGSQNDAEVQGDDYEDGMVWDDDTQSWKWPNP